MLKMESIHKRFNGAEVLKNVDLKVKKGEAVALIGPSGSGKTTLIRVINGFVLPDNGRVVVRGKEIDYRKKDELRQMRKRIGMIYQLFNLVDRTSAIDNVVSGALGRMDRGFELISSTIGLFSTEVRERAMELLNFVGIEDKAFERVDRLSGGQKQRVAIARALMQEPEILLADEPIANLDPRTSQKIMELLTKINRERGITIITVLHHLESVRDHFHRVVALKDGEICFDGRTDCLTREHISSIYEFAGEYECAAA
ncbi:MAG: phosphonate ABC transporter ATP-binding protein [Nitrospirae bacterium]|nr:phosphonate ABC transporter ATP-binding protein [Nitrospirota bacterium]MCL5421944.1 phosphonate ABC transporter ATP-binding protein [Nitrospirota bacterium]